MDFPSDKTYRCGWTGPGKDLTWRLPCCLPPRLGTPDFRLLVTGSTDWDDWDAMEAAFDKFEESRKVRFPDHRIVLVHGMLKGACRMAATMGPARYGWREEGHPALKSIYGRRFYAKLAHHLLATGVHQHFCFHTKSKLGEHRLAEKASRLCRLEDIETETVTPFEDLQRLAYKGLRVPTPLGGS